VIVPVLVATEALTVLFAPLLLTAPEAVESVIMPELAPTKPPTVLFAPLLLTAPEAVESPMLPTLAPTKPPTVLLAPVLVTAPKAVEPVMAPVPAPTKPPKQIAIVTVAAIRFFVPEPNAPAASPQMLASEAPSEKLSNKNWPSKKPIPTKETHTRAIETATPTAAA
jgi:hypothetical protein